MNLKSRYKRLSLWNKIALWGSFASIFAIILWGLDYLFNSFQEKKYLPVRETVVATIFQSYKSINNASEFVIAPDRISNTASVSPKQKLLITKWSLDPVEHDLKKLENIVLRNNAALDPQTILLVSTFIDSARSLQKRLTFFAQLYNPEMSHWDFVSVNPSKIFSKLEYIINEFKDMYPDVNLENNLKSTKELERIWIDVEKINNRLCLKVDQYKWKKDRRPMVFDTNDLVRLGGPSNSNYQALVYVYNLND